MSRNYGEVAARFWNLPAKGEEEARRESLFMDDMVQKGHIDRETESLLDGVATVFDGGAGTGRPRRGIRPYGHWADPLAGHVCIHAR